MSQKSHLHTPSQTDCLNKTLDNLPFLASIKALMFSFTAIPILSSLGEHVQYEDRTESRGEKLTEIVRKGAVSKYPSAGLHVMPLHSIYSTVLLNSVKKCSLRRLMSSVSFFLS